MIYMTGTKNRCEWCGTPENLTKILGFEMTYSMEVCKACYEDIFTDVANEGKAYFYQWATKMYGNPDRVNYLVDGVFGEGAGDEISKESKETMWLFTFGILKYPYNITREGGFHIVENSTVKGQVMHLYAASFPITRITDNDEDVIYGTLFEVPKSQVLYSYDGIEGYDPNRPADVNMYNRIEVEVTKPDGTTQMAQMYYANQRQFSGYLNEMTIIPTGNFDDKRKAKSYDYFTKKQYRTNNKKGGK
jgi:gamma-glutamylcyclotransferase (GGCT)/AIG2-like uncharacterized protein YtfP